MDDSLAQSNLLGPPYTWKRVQGVLDLDDDAMGKMLNSPSFLDPWVEFRDIVPLYPGAKIERMDDSTRTITEIFHLMLSMATVVYDRPTAVQRREWGVLNHYNCLVYQVCKNLARYNEPFEHSFETLDMIDDSPKAMACAIIEGISMLVVNLTYCYTNTQVDDEVHPFVVNIERACPTSDHMRSPIPSIRRDLYDHMSLQDVQDTAKARGLEEMVMKEWLVRFILRKDAAMKYPAQDGRPMVEGEGALRPLKRVRED